MLCDKRQNLLFCLLHADSAVSHPLCQTTGAMVLNAPRIHSVQDVITLMNGKIWSLHSTRTVGAVLVMPKPLQCIFRCKATLCTKCRYLNRIFQPPIRNQASYLDHSVFLQVKACIP